MPAIKNAADKTFTVSQLAAMYAADRDIDTSRAGKMIRSKLRANFDTVCKLDPSVRKIKSNANDGNRWPAMNDDVRKLALGIK